MTAPKDSLPGGPKSEVEPVNIPTFEEFTAAMENEGSEEATEESEEQTDEATAEEQTEEAAEEAEEAVEDTEQDKEYEPPWLAEFEKTGDSSVLPAPIRSKISRLMSRLGQAKADLDAEKARIAAQQPKPQEDAEDRPPPLDYTDQETLERSIDARARWIARKEAEQARASTDQKAEDAIKQLSELRVKAMSQERYDWLRAQDGWSADVENEMKQMASESEFWRGAYWDEDGIREFYGTARRRVESRGKTVQDAKRRAEIPKKILPRPSGGGVAAKAESTAKSPYEGLSVDEKLERIARDAAKEFGILG